MPQWTLLLTAAGCSDIKKPPGMSGTVMMSRSSPAHFPFEQPPDELPPDPAALAATAASYGIEILGPPPSLP